MRRRTRQSAPPKPYDVYRGLPMGAGGVEPLLFEGAHGRRDDERRRPAIPLDAMVDGLWRWLKSTASKLQRPPVGECSPTVAKSCS